MKKKAIVALSAALLFPVSPALADKGYVSLGIAPLTIRDNGHKSQAGNEFVGIGSAGEYDDLGVQFSAASADDHFGYDSSQFLFYARHKFYVNPYLRVSVGLGYTFMSLSGKSRAPRETIRKRGFGYSLGGEYFLGGRLSLRADYIQYLNMGGVSVDGISFGIALFR